MRAVTKPLDEQARTIFAELGYKVTNRGSEFLAERKWRMVHVTPAEEMEDPPDSGDFRCFVTWNDQVSRLERVVRREDPDYEWAIIGVDEEGDYEVASAPKAV